MPPEIFALAMVSRIVPAIVLLLLGYPLVRVVAARLMRGAPSLPDERERDARLERIERAVEAVALEVERIAEGQRYTTKLLSERSRTS